MTFYARLRWGSRTVRAQTWRNASGWREGRLSKGLPSEWEPSACAEIRHQRSKRVLARGSARQRGIKRAHGCRGWNSPSACVLGGGACNSKIKNEGTRRNSSFLLTEKPASSTNAPSSPRAPGARLHVNSHLGGGGGGERTWHLCGDRPSTWGGGGEEGRHLPRAGRKLPPHRRLPWHPSPARPRRRRRQSPDALRRGRPRERSAPPRPTRDRRPLRERGAAGHRLWQRLPGRPAPAGPGRTGPSRPVPAPAHPAAAAGASACTRASPPSASCRCSCSASCPPAPWPPGPAAAGAAPAGRRAPPPPPPPPRWRGGCPPRRRRGRRKARRGARRPGGSAGCSTAPWYRSCPSYRTAGIALRRAGPGRAGAKRRRPAAS